MNVAIIHHHLNRGGVTSVVVNHLRSLSAVAGSLRAAVFFGGRKEAWNDELARELGGVELSLHVVPELEYDEGRLPRPGELHERLRTVLKSAGLRPDETLLHVHNHSLGKNVSLPGALRLLAADGFPQLLQIHDFAEDLRPANYRRLQAALGAAELSASLYPQAPHVHYAVLNRRDAEILGRIADDSRVHFLPNPAAEFGDLPERHAVRNALERAFGIPTATRLVVSPVRGIRRKNVGELLLWAAAFGRDSVHACTLPPLNPAEQTSYRFWKTAAAELQLPCLFELGAPQHGLTFPEVLSASDALITTSVAEGFGMVFLEAWLAGRPLIGRDLPDVTADFKRAGVTLGGLSPEFLIPVDAVGIGEFRDRFTAAFRRLLEAYGRPVPTTDKLAAAAEEHLRDGLLDFAVLDRGLQYRVVSRAVAQSTLRGRIRSANPTHVAAASLDVADAGTIIADNAAAVRESYSIAGCGRR
ncbi:MAG: glycosyltransferase, partial [Planctomycetaceae bacterium]